MRAAATAGASLAVVAGVGALPQVARADSTVTVPANALPDTRTAQVGLVGCSSLYQRGTEPLRPRVARVADLGGGAPSSLGTRTVSYDLAGGNAVGPLYYRDSMLKTAVAGFEAYSGGGAAGVAYAGYQSPRADGDQIWIGRASLTLGARRWTTVDAARLTYTWTKYDMGTMKPLADDTARAPRTGTVAAFAAQHGGDGAGFYSVGFGCDGAKFSMDSWRVGSAGAVTTWNLEGLSTTTTSTTGGRTVRPGQSVTLTASLTNNVGAVVPNGSLQLQSKPAGSATWSVERVVGAADGSASTTITPTATTTYRWVFADRPLATGSSSAPVVVRVAPR